MRSPIKRQSGGKRPGSVVVYAVVMMVVLTGFVSLAVDFGRYELCHTQLYTACMAAARAGAANLPNGSSAAQAAAIATAGENAIDGQFVVASSNLTLTVQFLLWVSNTNFTVLTPANYSQANAISVSAQYTVPLVFAQVIGFPTKPAIESSTAMLVTTSSTQSVGATSNLWLSGEPTGTQASQPDPNYAGQGVNPDHKWQYDIAGPVGGSASDGEPYESPVQASITVVPGSTITLSNVSGLASNDGDVSPNASATGSQPGGFNIEDDAASGGVSEHGIADETAPVNSMNAVFLNNSLPDGTSAPAPLDFSTQAERDYTNLDPQLKQPFYVGTGVNSSGQTQSVVVPQGATRLFLGTMDGWEWSNNLGSFSVTITQSKVSTVQ